MGIASGPHFKQKQGFNANISARRRAAGQHRLFDKRPYGSYTNIKMGRADF
jgi:hypothetical protein